MSREIKIIISIVIVIIGGIILSSEYIYSKKISVYDYMNELYYNIDDANTEEIDSVETDRVDNQDEAVGETSYKLNEVKDESIYIGYLSIPDINLKKGFTTKESKYNTISKNIQILSASDYPDKENGNVIFAAHSGNSSVSRYVIKYLLK